MILIDNTYFTGELSLPNIPVNACQTETSGVKYALQTVGENNLDVFVDGYVSDYLIKMFGKQMAETFMEEMQKEEHHEIWVNLKNQLLLQFGSYKASPVANYVYYWLQRDARTKTTMAGEADDNFDNAQNVNNHHKLIKAWNTMVDMNLNVIKFLCENKDDYKQYMKCCYGIDIHQLTTKINTLNI